MSESQKNKTAQSVITDESSEEEYEVDKILKVRLNPKNKKKEYLVKWKSKLFSLLISCRDWWKKYYSIEDSTWEPEENLDNVRDIVVMFEQELKEKSLVSQVEQPKPQQQVQQPQQQQTGRKSAGKSMPETKRGQQTGKASRDYIQLDDNSREDNVNMEIEKSKGRKASLGCKVPSAFLEIQKEVQMVDYQEADQISQEQDIQEGQELIFEAIENKRIVSGKCEFLVKFQNMKQSQWVQENDLEDFKQEIANFNTKQQESMRKERSNRPEVVIPDKISERNISVDTKRSNIQEKENIAESVHKSKRTDSHQKGQQQVAPKGDFHQKKDAEESNVVLKGQESIPAKHSNKTQNQEKRAQETTQKEVQLVDQAIASKQKRQLDFSLDAIGDFRTDNVDKLIFLGNPRDFFSCRAEIHWKPRNDGSLPLSTIFSVSYLRREEPALLIDHMVSALQQQQI